MMSFQEVRFPIQLFVPKAKRRLFLDNAVVKVVRSGAGSVVNRWLISVARCEADGGHAHRCFMLEGVMRGAAREAKRLF